MDTQGNQSIPTPGQPVHFNYIEAARAAGVTQAELAAIIKVFEADYPFDLMLRELHIMRACHAISRGVVTAATLVAPDSGKAA